MREEGEDVGKANVDDLLTKSSHVSESSGSEGEGGKRLVHFIVFEGAHHDKVENARQGSATSDGVKVLVRNIYAVSDTPLLRAGNVIVNEGKSFVEMAVEADRHALANKVFADSNNYYREKKET